jgi:hypothetical protein
LRILLVLVDSAEIAIAKSLVFHDISSHMFPQPTKTHTHTLGALKTSKRPARSQIAGELHRCDRWTSRKKVVEETKHITYAAPSRNGMK